MSSSCMGSAQIPSSLAASSCVSPSVSMPLSIKRTVPFNSVVERRPCQVKWDMSLFSPPSPLGTKVNSQV